MKQTLNRIGLIFILALVNVSIARAEHDIDLRGVFGFTSSTSSLLNRSSIELATKHVNRSIRFAYKALEKKLNPMDELIANHNLCIAYLASDKTEMATQYCARAFELAQGPYSVVKIRGAFRLQGIDVNDTAQTTLSPVQVIVSNIQQQNSQIRFTLLMK